MTDKEVQKQAADTLLERGVRFPIPAPFFLRLLGKKTVNLTIRRPKWGTLIRISKGFVEMGIEPDDLDSIEYGKAFELCAKHGDKFTIVLATAILNSRFKIRLFSKVLAKYIKNHLNAQRVQELFMLVITIGGIENFTSTIRYLPKLNNLKRRENLSPKEEGS